MLEREPARLQADQPFKACSIRCSEQDTLLFSASILSHSMSLHSNQVPAEITASKMLCRLEMLEKLDSRWTQVQAKKDRQLASSSCYKS